MQVPNFEIFFLNVSVTVYALLKTTYFISYLKYLQVLMVPIFNMNLDHAEASILVHCAEMSQIVRFS